MTHIAVLRTHLNMVSKKVAVFGSVLKSFTENSTDARIDSVDVKPLNDHENTLMLVTISYTWDNQYPVPQKFEAYFGDSKKAERKEYIEEMCSTWGK